METHTTARPREAAAQPRHRMFHWFPNAIGPSVPGDKAACGLAKATTDQSRPGPGDEVCVVCIGLSGRPV